jgi:hypothetical protein
MNNKIAVFIFKLVFISIAVIISVFCVYAIIQNINYKKNILPINIYVCSNETSPEQAPGYP